MDVKIFILQNELFKAGIGIEATQLNTIVNKWDELKGEHPKQKPLTPQLRITKEYLEEVLTSCNFNRGLTAKFIGVSERNLYRWLKRYELNY